MIKHHHNWFPLKISKRCLHDEKAIKRVGEWMKYYLDQVCAMKIDLGPLKNLLDANVEEEK